MEKETANPTVATEAAKQTSHETAEQNGASSPEAAADRQPAVRYMDDATFRRCLDKVVTVHDRLLAELAK